MPAALSSSPMPAAIVSSNYPLRANRWPPGVDLAAGRARRGTAFHRWLEQHYGAQQLIDPADLPGGSDADPEAEADLAFLRELFESGTWASRCRGRIAGKRLRNLG